jgi:penicillin amidase
VQKALRFLRFAVAGVVLLASLGALAGWWMLHRTLPQLDGMISLPGLHAEVTVDRDRWGVPHIRAQSLDDLLLAQGFVLAQDRLWQMDVLRRAAAGELSEIFGSPTVEYDRESRVLGFRQAAEATIAAMPADRRALLEAYARGVNLYIEQRRGRLPAEFLVLRYEPRPWTPVDTLLIGANLYKELTGFWRDQLRRAQVSELVGPELARDLYADTADSVWDHPLVGAASQPAKSSPEAKRGAKNVFDPGSSSVAENSLPTAPPSPWTPAEGPLPSFDYEGRTVGGSNNWVVDGRHTISGRPMLANDTHLTFGVPCIWYIVHLTAPGWNVKGFTLPGAPLVLIGHNDRVAWGFTNNFADVLDVYSETFNPANPLEYRHNGQWLRATVRHEVIRVNGKPDQTLDVLITRHGPIIRHDDQRGYAIRWTATDPGGLDSSYYLLGKAQNWNEFRAALQGSPGPAQNIVYADVDGHIGYVVAAKVPIRAKPTGGVPVPGDTDDHEWTGYIPYAELPQLVDPPSGIIATANARVVGPAYPYHLTDNWMAPYRTARIYELLADSKNLRNDDFIRIQTDISTYPHRQIAQELLKARGKVHATDPRTRNLLDTLANWDGKARIDSRTMSFLEFTRRALLYHLLRPHLGAGVGLYQWMRAGVFVEKVLQDRPTRWLPPEFHSYDELLISSADYAVERMADAARTEDPKEWQWGTFNQLRMFHPLAQSGFLRRHVSIGPIPISGSLFSVKQIARTYGPAMRFVADLSNFDNSMMNIAMGQSGQYLSLHYRDQFPYWYTDRGIVSAFSDAVEDQLSVSRERLVPAAQR